MVHLQDRTGRLIFKLFDKDPSHFPGTLRTKVSLLYILVLCVFLIYLHGDAVMDAF
jgi:hypothetical protein